MAVRISKQKVQEIRKKQIEEGNTPCFRASGKNLEWCKACSYKSNCLNLQTYP